MTVKTQWAQLAAVRGAINQVLLVFLSEFLSDKVLLDIYMLAFFIFFILDNFFDKYRKSFLI